MFERPLCSISVRQEGPLLYDVFDIRWIGESSLHKNYDLFFRFYQKVWEQSHAYIVMNARRCFNLNHVFLKVHTAAGGQAANAGRIISNNALLLCAGDIAGFFREHGRFPSILIADDLVLHGRGVSKLLSDLEELIVEELHDSNEEMNRYKRYYIRRSLASAVDIFTFAVNKQPLLISDIYRQNLHWEVSLYTREIRSLSQQISSFLQKADNPNTSYVLSHLIPPVCNAPKGWRAQEWSYRGVRQSVFFHQDAPLNFLPTVRLRKPYGQQAPRDMWLTSLTLLGELSKDVLFDACRKVEEALPPGQFDRVRAILQKQHPILQKQQAQFLSFLLSAIYLREFLAGLGIAFSTKNSDLDKIARNFGCDMEKELNPLISSAPLMAAIHNALKSALCAGARPFLQEPPEAGKSASSWDRESVNFFLEDYFYDVGMTSERSAYAVISTNRLPGKEDLSSVPMETLLRGKAPRLRWDSPKCWNCSSQEKLSCMFSMMDNGLMAMNFEVDPASGTVYSSLKAGELATFSIPRRLHLFIPALALVEQDSWQLDMEPEDAVQQFIQSLPEPAEDGLQAEKERAALAFLKSQGSDFVSLLYQCGQTLAGWDIDLVTTDDWLEEEGGESYLSFVRRETGRRDFYLTLARQFLTRIF